MTSLPKVVRRLAEHPGRHATVTLTPVVGRFLDLPAAQRRERARIRGERRHRWATHEHPKPPGQTPPTFVDRALEDGFSTAVEP